MRRASIVIAAGALLVLAGCGGGGGKKAVGTATAPTTTAVSGATDAGSASAGAAAPSTPAAGQASAPAGTAPPATAAPTPAPAAAAAPAPAASAAKSPSAPPAGNASGPKYPGKPVTQPGHYHYTVSGSSSFGPPPPGSDETVDPPDRSAQHTRMTTSSPQGSSTSDTTVDYQADGVHLVDLTTQSAGYTLQFHPAPAPLLIPASMASGAKVGPFDITSADGKEVATITVTIQQSNVSVATGDGTAHPTLQVEVDTVLKCAPGQACQLTGTVNSTRWLGYDGLEVKDRSLSNISFGAYKFTADTTSLLDKATPS